MLTDNIANTTPPSVQSTIDTHIIVSADTCRNYSFFRDVLKEYRKTDDNVMLKLNEMPRKQEDRAICQSFLESLVQSYNYRQVIISTCNKILHQDVTQAEAYAKANPKDYCAAGELHTATLKQRMAQNENEVEDILKERTLLIFKRKCRLYAMSPEFQQIQHRFQV